MFSKVFLASFHLVPVTFFDVGSEKTILTQITTQILQKIVKKKTYHLCSFSFTAATKQAAIHNNEERFFKNYFLLSILLWVEVFLLPW